MNERGRLYSRGMATRTRSGTDPLAAGHAALRSAAWDEARTNFEAAIAEGSTLVRIGTAIFGERSRERAN